MAGPTFENRTFSSEKGQTIISDKETGSRSIQDLEDFVNGMSSSEVRYDALIKEAEGRLKDLEKFDSEKYNNYPKWIIDGLKTIKVLPDAKKRADIFIKNLEGVCEELKFKTEDAEKKFEKLDSCVLNFYDKRMAAGQLRSNYESITADLNQEKETVEGQIKEAQREGKYNQADMYRQQQSKLNRDIRLAENKMLNYAAKYLGSEKQEQKAEQLKHRAYNKLSTLRDHLLDTCIILDQIKLDVDNNGEFDVKDTLLLLKQSCTCGKKAEQLNKLINYDNDLFDRLGSSVQISSPEPVTGYKSKQSKINEEAKKSYEAAIKA